MATQIVTPENLPPHKAWRNDVGFDTSCAAEKARWALNGAEAVAGVIHANIEGENEGFWSRGFIWQLQQGHDVLVAFAREQVEALAHELWYTHAMLGDYGPEAKARAQRELAEGAA